MAVVVLAAGNVSQSLGGTRLRNLALIAGLLFAFLMLGIALTRGGDPAVAVDNVPTATAVATAVLVDERLGEGVDSAEIAASPDQTPPQLTIAQPQRNYFAASAMLLLAALLTRLVRNRLFRST